MREIILLLFKKVIELGDFEFSHAEVRTHGLGFEPASLELIKQAEERLGVIFPNDYKEFLLISNGIKEYSQVEPSFLPIDKINWANEIFTTSLDGSFYDPVTTDIHNRSILIGGLNEEQFIFLVSPNNPNGKWIYWKSAFWDPIGAEYDCLADYFLDVIEFMQDELDYRDNTSI